MASESHAQSDHHDPHGDEHHGGIGKYLVVFVALCVLTGASFFTCSSYWPFHDTPSIGWAFMMAVSCTKAMLVILFFMHLLWEANWKYILTIPSMFMSIFLVCMLIPDVGLRARNYSEERQVFASEIEQHDAEQHDAEQHDAEQHDAEQHDDEQHAGDHGQTTAAGAAAAHGDAH